MPPALPGFHYDAEKKKYFKIQPNHVAAYGSAARKYSEATLKKEAEERCESKRRKLLEQQQSEMRLRRSKVLESPLGGGWGLKRELGVVTTFHESSSRMMMRAWAQGLRRENVSRFRCEDGGGGSGTFVFDSATGVLTHAEVLRGSGAGASFSVRHIAAPSHCDSLGGKGWVDTGAPLGCQIFDSQVVSMDILPSRVLLTTSMGGSQPACVHLTKLVEPEVWRARYQDPTETQSHERDNDPLSYTGDISTVIRGPLHGTFWASSPRPDSTTSDFAIATTYGSTLVVGSESSWSVHRTQSFERKRVFFDNDTAAARSSEVLAVDWLDVNVLLNGCRDGAVRLWDTRFRSAAGTSRRLTHPSCINHVRRLGGGVNRIVVAGMEGWMAVYDLRYIAPAAAVKGGFGVVTATRPYVEFPAYRNRELNGVAVGFDVWGDLVAAGTDEGGWWQVLDGASGREVQVGGDRGGGNEKGERGLGGPARCLQFVEMEEGRGGTGLFVAGGRGIERWAW